MFAEGFEDLGFGSQGDTTLPCTEIRSSCQLAVEAQVGKDVSTVIMTGYIHGSAPVDVSNPRDGECNSVSNLRNPDSLTCCGSGYPTSFIPVALVISHRLYS